MRAWQAGNLSLPHYSGAQYSMFAHRPVPLDQLAPGDLVTTSSGWSNHIGIAVPGGYVHATHTGDFVRFVPGTSGLTAAVRPG
jgi:cell wall-associated NlpC family hydrolase